MGTFATSLIIDDDADLERAAAVRGLVERRRLSRAMSESGTSGILELAGGAGWGKSSAALQHAVRAQQDGIAVHFLSDASEPIRPGRGAELYVVDARTVAPRMIDALLSSVLGGQPVQVMVSARAGHELVERAVAEGLVPRRIDLETFPLTPDELRRMASHRGATLRAATADYVAPALAGWPVVGARFLRHLAGRPANAPLSMIDALVAQSFEEILVEYLGASSLRLLVRASVGASINADAAPASEDPAVTELYRRIGELGLGEWRAA